ncbi:MAG: acyl-CoA thioesterase [Hymenobacteraceae bacterium]|nr:acyl-CoA thioesterase [Hymenobacteraceae bacterium]
MFQHTTSLRVRYAETDQMGYVYYGQYAAYYEVARTEAFRALGLPYAAMEAAGVMLPVIEFGIRYRRPAYYDDLLTLELRLLQLPTASSIRSEIETRNEAGEVLNTGFTTLVFAAKATGRPTRIPEHIRARLAPYFELRTEN